MNFSSGRTAERKKLIEIAFLVSVESGSQTGKCMVYASSYMQPEVYTDSDIFNAILHVVSFPAPHDRVHTTMSGEYTKFMKL